MKKNIFFITILTALLTTFVFAKENSSVYITVKSFQKKVVVNKDGKKIVKWDKVTKVVPKDIVKYIDTITNNTNSDLESVKVKNSIDPNTILIKNSAKSNAKFKTLYSIDGGKTFAKASELFVKDKSGKKRLATIKDYNAIEFIVDKVPAKSKIDIEFKVKIK